MSAVTPSHTTKPRPYRRMREGPRQEAFDKIANGVIHLIALSCDVKQLLEKFHEAVQGNVITSPAAHGSGAWHTTCQEAHGKCGPPRRCAAECHEDAPNGMTTPLREAQPPACVTPQRVASLSPPATPKMMFRGHDDKVAGPVTPITPRRMEMIEVKTEWAALPPIPAFPAWGASGVSGATAMLATSPETRGVDNGAGRKCVSLHLVDMNATRQDCGGAGMDGTRGASPAVRDDWCSKAQSRRVHMNGDRNVNAGPPWGRRGHGWGRNAGPYTPPPSVAVYRRRWRNLKTICTQGLVRPTRV